MVLKIFSVFFLFYLSPISGSQKMQDKLESLYLDYQKVNSAPTVRSYIDLHMRLLKLQSDLPSLRDTKKYDPEYDKKYFKDKYRSMGLVIGHYSEQIMYTGKFLGLAHRINPSSEYRSYTLYSEVLGELTSHGLGVMPNVKVARAYEKEFPEGPFIVEVYDVLAGFHKDLFLVLSENRKDYKYDCYKEFITKKSLNYQIEKNKNLSLSYYEKIKNKKPSHFSVSSKYIEKIKKHPSEKMNEWSFCGD